MKLTFQNRNIYILVIMSLNMTFFKASLIQISLQDSDTADSLASESRRRPRKQKFQGVPGIAGRDFPTLGSIPMTRSNFGFNFSLLLSHIVTVSHVLEPMLDSTLILRQIARYHLIVSIYFCLLYNLHHSYRLLLQNIMDGGCEVLVTQK